MPQSAIQAAREVEVERQHKSTNAIWLEKYRMLTQQDNYSRQLAKYTKR